MAGAALAMMIVGAFLVAGVAIWLLLTATSLDQIATRLDMIAGATAGIDDQLQPVPGVVGGIASDVGAIQSALHGVLSAATNGGAVPVAPPAQPASQPATVPAALPTRDDGQPDYVAARALVRRKRF